MTPTAVIASRRDNGDWSDLDLAVRSLRHYSDCTVVVAWQGPTEPDVPAHLVVRQPDDCSTFGAAYDFAVATTDATMLIVCNDDIVVCPDTVRMLVEDWGTARERGPVGFVAARADYARPSQRSAGPSDIIEPAAAVSPICALVEAAALPDRWPDCNWFSDDILCADMAAAGRQSWISRAYVHHLGERTTGSDHRALAAEGMAWVRQHRPELASAS